MSPSAPPCIAVLGAPGTGAEPLAHALRQALPDHHITEELGSSQRPDLVLLIGLPPADMLADTPQDAEHAENALRTQLLHLGLPFRLVYGRTPSERLSQALLALGLSPTDPALRSAREQAQYQLNRGRTPWSCENCSDPDCEHRLFTGLLKPPTA